MRDRRRPTPASPSTANPAASFTRSDFMDLPPLEELPLPGLRRRAVVVRSHARRRAERRPRTRRRGRIGTRRHAGEREEDGRDDGGEGGEHERVRAVAAKCSRTAVSSPPSAPSAKPSPSRYGPRVLSRERKPTTMQTIPISTHSSTQRERVPGRLRARVDRASTAARCARRDLRRGALRAPAALALVVPAHVRRAYRCTRILVWVPRNDPTDTGGLFIGRRPGTGPVHYRGEPERGGAAAPAGRRRARRAACCVRRGAAVPVGVGAAAAGVAVDRLPGRLPRGLEHARDRRRLLRHPRLAVRHAGARDAAGPRLAAAAPRRGPRPARRRAGRASSAPRRCRAGRCSASGSS